MEEFFAAFAEEIAFDSLFFLPDMSPTARKITYAVLATTAIIGIGYALNSHNRDDAGSNQPENTLPKGASDTEKLSQSMISAQTTKV